MRHLQTFNRTLFEQDQANVRRARQQLAETLERTPNSLIATQYTGQTGAIHRALTARLQSEYPDTPAERKQARRLLKKLPRSIKGNKGISVLLAAMLYHRAYDLPCIYSLESLPEWFITDYVKYMTNPALMFCTPGETNRYLLHMEQWIDYLHSSITANLSAPFWQQIASLLVQHANFGPLYFTGGNLKLVYVQRGEIIEHALRFKGYTVDYETPVNTDGKPLRIGILSMHCRPSPETFAMLPVFENHDNRNEIILYLLHSDNQALEQYCAERTSTVRSLPVDLKSQADLIRSDRLDVLFVATNITSVCNPVCLLAAHRLARVQIAGTGSVTTTGLRNIDYYMTGSATDATQNIDHYSEALLWLDGPAHCFSYGPPQAHVTTPVSRADLGIADQATVYVSGANMIKIVPELMVLWAKLLGRQNDTVLMLYPYGPNWSNSYPKELFWNRLLSFMNAHGVTEDRLRLLDPEPVPDRNQIREYLRLTDIYLDSYPFSGTTSLVEPLEVGLPIVSQSGMNFRSSMGAALLRSINMHEMVAHSDQGYIEIARTLRDDLALRSNIRNRILVAMEARPPFLDSLSYSKQVSRLFSNAVWERSPSPTADQE